MRQCATGYLQLPTADRPATRTGSVMPRDSAACRICPGLRDYNSGTSPLQTFRWQCLLHLYVLLHGDWSAQQRLRWFWSRHHHHGSRDSRALDPILLQWDRLIRPRSTTIPSSRGLRDPTKCNYPTGDCGTNTDPVNLKCNGTNDIDEKNCMATVLDHYTTSFNFAQKNFSAIWLRPWWKLVTDSAITDQLGPGLDLCHRRRLHPIRQLAGKLECRLCVTFM